jgi:hypothetical protein
VNPSDSTPPAYSAETEMSFYGTRRFMTIETKSNHWILLLVISNQRTPLNAGFHLRLDLQYDLVCVHKVSATTDPTRQNVLKTFCTLKFGTVWEPSA